MEKKLRPPDELTHDFFFRKKVAVFQYRKGYRFAVDAPILASFLPPSPGPVLEVGCGSGIVSLLALHLGKFSAVSAIEIQPRLAKLARKNTIANAMRGRLSVTCGDYRKIFSRFPDRQLVFSNPPFTATGRGRLSRSEEIRFAKFEITLTLEEMIKTASLILVPGGGLCLIFPWERWRELESKAAEASLHPARIRQVLPFPGSPPDRLLVEWRKGGASEQELSPLVVFRERGIYSSEMESILTGEQ